MKRYLISVSDSLVLNTEIELEKKWNFQKHNNGIICYNFPRILLWILSLHQKKSRFFLPKNLSPNVIRLKFSILFYGTLNRIWLLICVRAYTVGSLLLKSTECANSMCRIQIFKVIICEPLKDQWGRVLIFFLYSKCSNWIKL